jgi:hypothetical protein
MHPIIQLHQKVAAGGSKQPATLWQAGHVVNDLVRWRG